MHSAVQRPPAPLPMSTRVLRVAVSFVLVAIGVATLIQSGLGVAPFDVLNTGVADTLGIPVSVAFLANAMLCYVLGIVLGGKVGWASLIGTVVISPLLQICLAIIPDPDALAIRIPMFAAGLAVLTVAICLVISTEMGAGPTEVVMLGMVARGMSVHRSRWIIDGIAFVLGVALGGAAGVGTIVITFALGPLVAFGLRRLHYVPPGALPVEAAIAGA